MQLSQTERERLSAILEQYDHHPKVQEMREFIQHGDVTTYQHCKNVVVVSCDTSCPPSICSVTAPAASAPVLPAM